MELSLRQTHKLVEKLNGFIAEHTPSPVISVNVFDVSANAAIPRFAEEEAKFKAATVRHFSTLALRQQLRNYISVQNSLGGINELLGQRKVLCEKLSFIRSILNGRSDLVNTSAGVSNLIRKKQESVTSNVYQADTVEFTVLNVLERENMQSLVNILQRQLESTDEEISTKNATLKIFLTVDQVQQLVELNIM